MHMKFAGTAHEVHAADQAHKAEVMIAMQVADEDVPDPIERRSRCSQALLGPFAAINQVVLTMHDEQLSRREPSTGRQCGTGAKCDQVELAMCHGKQEGPTWGLLKQSYLEAAHRLTIIRPVKLLGPLSTLYR